MGRKRSSEKIRVLLLVEKEPYELLRFHNVNRSSLMNRAMKDFIEKNGLKENKDE